MPKKRRPPRTPRSESSASSRESDRSDGDDDLDVLEDEVRSGIRSSLLSKGGKGLRKLSTALRKADDEELGYLTKRGFKDAAHGCGVLEEEEVDWLASQLKGRRRGHVMYERLKEVITEGEYVFDDGDDEGWKGFTTERWAVRPGSVGEWLQNVATPMDRKNFKDFMTVVRKFEEDKGIDVKRDQGGEGGAVTVRLGPMLNVALKFYVE